MQRNLYFSTLMRRQNVLKSFILDAFLGIASYPRLLLEVFIRKNFGQRYFSIATVVTISIIMALSPLIGDKLSSLRSQDYGGNRGSFWGHYATWYLFLFAFIYFAWLRWREVKINSSIFDFSRFSLYSGNIHPFFRNLKIAGKTQSIRSIETLLEPTLFFLAGVALLIIGQKLGILLMISSIIYSISYSAAYKNGDNFVMDKIDEIIMNEELTNAFVDDMGAENTRGVRFHMRKPKAKAMRKKLAESFLENDQNVTTEPVTTAQ